MKLLFPNIDLQGAFLGIQSNDPVRHANALEFLEITLSSPLRFLLLPLIDAEVGLEERMRLASRLLRREVARNEEAVATLLHSQDPWLRSCAAYAIGKLLLKSFEPELDQCASDPDPVLRRRVEEAKLALRG
jgi:hypothetical protein